MGKGIIRCEICGRQIIPDSDETTDRTIGKDWGHGKCLLLVRGVACPQCHDDEVEFMELFEGGYNG